MSQQPFKYRDVLYRAGVPFEVARVLPDKIQLENTATSELRDTTVDKLLTEYVGSELKVGLTPDIDRQQQPVAERANADTGLERLGDKARASTIRRISWTTKLESMGAFERPRLMAECVQRIAEELGETTPPHVSTLYRWRRKLRLAKKDLRALFARLDLRGGRGGTRFPVEVEASITEAVDSIFLRQKRSSAAEVRNAVVLEIKRLNQYRTATDQLPIPSLRTIQSRLAKLYAFDVTVACITLPELERLIHVWIVDVYHQRPHAGLDGRTPSAVWAESAEVHPPRLKVDVDTLDVELSEVDERSLGRGGIEINNNRYTSERCACGTTRQVDDAADHARSYWDCGRHSSSCCGGARLLCLSPSKHRLHSPPNARRALHAPRL